MSRFFFGRSDGEQAADVIANRALDSAGARMSAALKPSAATRLVPRQFVGVRSDVFQIAKSGSPLWPIERFAPIVRDSHYLSLVQLTNAYVPINAAISIIG